MTVPMCGGGRVDEPAGDPRIDAVNNLYVTVQDAYRIRKIDRTTPKVSTITRTAGRFGNPTSIVYVPGTNRLYVVDNVQHRVRVIQ